MRIEGCVSVVTGGASGLGESIVRLFHTLGGKLAIWDINESLGIKLASELGNTVIFCKVDISSENSVNAALKETINRLGNIQVLANCAGIDFSKMTITSKAIHSLADFQKVINVNIIGTFNVSRVVAKHMAGNSGSGPEEEGFREKGVIINVASTMGYEGQRGKVAYASSKGGILGITLPMARDLASYGIRVNSVAPGLFGPTRMTEMLDKQTYQEIVKTWPIKRWGEPREFAHAVKFLVENTYMNGTTFRLDGGVNVPNL